MQPADDADWPNAHNISTFIPSSGRPRRINPTAANHDHRAVAIHSLYITVKFRLLHVTYVSLLCIIYTVTCRNVTY